MKKLIGDSKFRLLCAYSNKPNGTLYSKIEKEDYENIVCYYSNDNVIKESITIIRHDLAFLKMIEHVYKHWENIDRCVLFMNDSSDCTESKIGVWDKSDFTKNKLATLILEKQQRGVFCLGIEGKMR